MWWRGEAEPEANMGAAQKETQAGQITRLNRAPIVGYFQPIMLENARRMASFSD